MNMVTQFLCSEPVMYTSPGRMYARVGVQDPTICTYVAVFFGVWLYDMCRYLLGHGSSLQSDRSISMCVYVRDKLDNATYASTRWVPTVRHFLACEDVAGGSQQSGGESFFLPGRTSLRAKVSLVGPSG